MSMKYLSLILKYNKSTSQIGQLRILSFYCYILLQWFVPRIVYICKRYKYLPGTNTTKIGRREEVRKKKKFKLNTRRAVFISRLPCPLSLSLFIPPSYTQRSGTLISAFSNTSDFFLIILYYFFLFVVFLPCRFYYTIRNIIYVLMTYLLFFVSIYLFILVVNG